MFTRSQITNKTMVLASQNESKWGCYGDIIKLVMAFVAGLSQQDMVTLCICRINVIYGKKVEFHMYFQNQRDLWEKKSSFTYGSSTMID